ncbi:hypothetical protein Taro_022605 [Colocasia esculenta]|uniref:Uncharacterized protein n=1 Tax=Colocasia esculenta TaxID=4460 RepID=A0A843V8V2_COLES|nr:hypothetical protein [Colocasia esculenta]
MLTTPSFPSGAEGEVGEVIPRTFGTGAHGPHRGKGRFHSLTGNLHPSSRTMPRDIVLPQLLSLFPIASLRIASRAELTSRYGNTAYDGVDDIDESANLKKLSPSRLILVVWPSKGLFHAVDYENHATTMDECLIDSFNIPLGSDTVFFIASILLNVPIYDNMMVPVCRHLTGIPQGLTPF